MKWIKTGIIALTLVFCFGSAAQAEFANYTADLVGHWKFSGNAEDSTSNDNDGDVYGAVLTTDRFGNASSAYSFDGNDDYISVDDDSSLNPSSAITISAWFKLNENKYATNLVVKDDYDASKRDYILYTNWLAASFCSFTDVSHKAASGGSLSLGAWHHMVGTYDGSDVKIYLDGVLKDSVALTGTLKDTDTPLWFGKTNDTPFNRYLNGSLDDVRIYDRAFSECDVQKLYIEELQNAQ